MQEISHVSNSSSGFWARHRGAGSIAVRAGSLLIACVLLVDAAPARPQNPWTLSPFFVVSGGHESNLLLDPEGAAVVVPGGSFLDLSPGFELTHRPSRTLDFRLGTKATAERFFNDTDRTLYGHVLWGDLLLSLASRVHLRFSLSGDYFNDTQQNELRRWGGGGEFGLDYFFRRLRLEGFVGGRGVSYPRADALNDAGQPTSYQEDRWNVGAVASATPTAGLLVRASLVARSTNSIDPQYDGSALLGDLALRWTPRARLAIDLHYGRQDRRFDHRSASLDEDAYWEWGAAASYEFAPGASLGLRLSRGIYSDAQSNEQDTDRIELSLRLGPSLFGARSRLALPADLGSNSEPGFGPKQENEGTVFRIRAPRASRVSVTGDFAHWKAGGVDLRPAGDGWWQLTLKIPPGHYQYLYLVDGEPLTPPESAIAVDDGFGGHNGLLEVR